MNDARGDAIVLGAYARMPDGKHGWVVELEVTHVKHELVHLEDEQGRRRIFRTDQVVTVKPTALAKARRIGVRKTLAAIAEQAHRGRRI